MIGVLRSKPYELEFIDKTISFCASLPGNRLRLLTFHREVDFSAAISDAAGTAPIWTSYLQSATGFDGSRFVSYTLVLKS